MATMEEIYALLIQINARLEAVEKSIAQLHSTTKVNPEETLSCAARAENKRLAKLPIEELKRIYGGRQKGKSVISSDQPDTRDNLKAQRRKLKK